jgi:hypothetical protein
MSRFANEGTTDRVIRIILGIVLLLAALLSYGTLAIVLWVLGAIAFLTGIIGICPFYLPFKINTRRK